MRALPSIALLIGLLAGCATPPPQAYTRGAGETAATREVALGNNAAGEACTAQTGTDRADVYCGTWRQPSARIRAAGQAGSADLTQLATASPWRTGIDTRYACAPPSSTTILNGQPALLMQCSRRIGGWPYVAMVARSGGGVWVADGVLPATPAIERAIGVLSGQTAAASAAPSGAEALLADRLAARAFGSSDIGLSDELMIKGSRANQTGNPVAAEHAYRSALAVQEKAFGKNDPRTSVTLTRLALQLSYQERYTEAEDLFREADALAPRDQSDPLAVPLLLQYRAMSDVQQGRMDEALPLLARAEAGFAALAPPGTIQKRAPSAASVNPFLSKTLSRMAPLLSDAQLLRDPTEEAARDHIVEVRRYRAVALIALGRKEEGNAALQSAVDLQRATGEADSVEYARVARNTGVLAASPAEALSQLTSAEAAFRHQLPGSRSLIETDLLRASEMAQAGERRDALATCRSAVASLAALKAGVRPELVAPCLDIYAQAAARDRDNDQPLLAEMFLASQLAQGNATVQQIAQATVRLQENARDPKVGEAIRAHEDAVARLDGLQRERDELAARPSGGSGQPQAADLDKQIADAQAGLADTEDALQAASPNYGQLVQQVVPAKAVFDALQPGEAFAAIIVGTEGGWVFLLRDGRIEVAKMSANSDRIDQLVKSVRASIVPTAASPPRFDTGAAHEVYAQTLGLLKPGLEGVTSLTVAPTGALLALPFEVMLTGNADPNRLDSAPWLMREMTIAHVPSAGNFVSLRRSAGGSRASQPWFGFGDFRRVSLAQAEHAYPGVACGGSAKALAEAPILPGAIKELEVARVILHADKSAELLGAAFTVDAVIRAPLRDYRILHFATHAILPSDLACQRDPIILASPPPGATDATKAMLSSNEILRLQVDADAVILSACDTGGLGGSVAGESLSDLARSFFFAGARSLLVTHWAVNDQAGAYLVANTLSRLEAKPSEGLGGALRETQLAVLADAGHGLPAEFAHPYYWAPFALIGNTGTGAPAKARTASAAPIPIRPPASGP